MSVHFTTAERRALQQIATVDGKLAVVAADHGSNLEEMLRTAGRPADAESVRAFKGELAKAVARRASALLLDPEISLPSLVDDSLIARDLGLIIRIEGDEPEPEDGLLRTQIIPNLGAAGVRRLGGAAAKVMVMVRADREDLNGYTATLVRNVLEECRREELLCVVEGMTYRIDGEPKDVYVRQRPQRVRACAEFLAACGAKLLKLEYPGCAEACRAVTESIDAPWAVLSAGVDHEEFTRQLQHALDAGAIGFIAGRSLWKEAAVSADPERRRLLRDVVTRRVDELCELLDRAGNSWYASAA
jgi:tagatose 1,6-diphosphate aldolase